MAPPHPSPGFGLVPPPSTHRQSSGSDFAQPKAGCGSAAPWRHPRWAPTRNRALPALGPVAGGASKKGAFQAREWQGIMAGSSAGCKKWWDIMIVIGTSRHSGCKHDTKVNIKKCSVGTFDKHLRWELQIFVKTVEAKGLTPHSHLPLARLYAPWILRRHPDARTWPNPQSASAGAAHTYPASWWAGILPMYLTHPWLAYLPTFGWFLW